MNELIKFVKETFTVNEYGDQVKERSERCVFAEQKSIRQSEFYQAQAVGLKPEVVFVLKDYLDYQGEEIVEHKPFNTSKWIKYRVLRTYRDSNSIEIVCTKGIEK